MSLFTVTKIKAYLAVIPLVLLLLANGMYPIVVGQTHMVKLEYKDNKVVQWELEELLNNYATFQQDYAVKHLGNTKAKTVTEDDLTLIKGRAIDEYIKQKAYSSFFMSEITVEYINSILTEGQRNYIKKRAKETKDRKQAIIDIYLKWVILDIEF